MSLSRLHSAFLATAWLAAAASAGASPGGQAGATGPIDGLVNTGAGVAPGQQDNYYVFEVVSGTAPAGDGFGYVASGNNYPVGSWLTNDAVSQWLSPTANGWQSYDPSSNGSYRWTLQFDLAGYNPATASLAGRVAADDSVQVLLNGHLLTSATGFGSWHGFSAGGSSFVAGINTFEFVVTNQAGLIGNPTGLRVEFTQSQVTAVPEPATWAMLLAGLLATGTLAARRRRDD